MSKEDCPHCGRCKHCGRADQAQVPYWPVAPLYPYTPTYPWWGIPYPHITWTVSSAQVTPNTAFTLSSTAQPAG